jgi:hypothetical protein
MIWCVCGGGGGGLGGNWDFLSWGYLLGSGHGASRDFDGGVLRSLRSRYDSRDPRR